VNYILDAGPLIAALNRRDQHHAWAVATLGSLPGPFYSCSEALAEAAALTRQAPAIVQMVLEGSILVEFSLAAEANAVLKLLQKYRDRRMDLADACIVRMSELIPRSCVITVDRGDFSVFRKSDRTEIEFVAP
jgi:predicted nucleic acid-binding protein